MLRNSERVGQWWLEEVGAEVHGVVYDQAKKLVDADTSRVGLIRAWHDMYKDRPWRDAGFEAYFRDRKTRSNVLTGGIDTVHARHARTRPLPQVITTGGSTARQRKAKDLTRYLHGEFTRLRVHDKGVKALLNALIAGTGCIKGHVHDGMPALDLVKREELYVDPVEEACNHVRTLYQVKKMDRGVLKAMYPEHEDEIEKASAIQESENAVYGDMIDVVEVWHLRSGKDAKDGRHSICTSECTLLHEEWDWETFPFAFFRAYHDPEGHWGISLAERMAGTQSEINDVCSKNSEGFKLASPFLITSAASGFAKKQIENAPMGIYSVDGPLSEAVQVVTPPGASEQHLRREDQLRERCLQDNGISQLSAQSQKPAGLNSGKALMVHQDVETGRFAIQANDYEQFYVDIAELLLKLLEEAIEDMDDAEDDEEKPESPLRVLVEEKGVLSEISYEDVRMTEDDPYRVKTLPVSSLSHSVAGRIAEVSELNQLGLIPDPGTALELLSMPDLERHTDLETAARQLADVMIEKALDGESVSANKYMPLDYLIKRGIQHFNLAQLQGVPPSELVELEMLISHAETILAEEQAKMQPPQPQMPAGPPPGPAPAMPQDPMQGAA